MASRLRDTTALTVASLVSGLLAYVFFAMTTRTLGATAAAPVSVLWTYWTFSSAAFTFPLQHWVARTVAADDGEAAVHRALPRVAAVVVATSALTGVVAWLLRGVLFPGAPGGFPLLVALVTLGSGFVGVVRGGLTARHRFVALATALVAENGLRCLVAGVLILAGARDPLAYGIALAVGGLVGLLWPSAVRFQAGIAEGAASSSLRFLGGASGGQLVGQAVLTAGPVVLALLGGSPAEVTALFAGLALFRAPYTAAIAVVAKVTGWLTVRYVRHDDVALRKARLGLVTGTVVATPLAAAVGAWAGPWLLPLVFGGDVQLSAGLCAVVAAGSTVALANLVSTVMLMAQGRTWGVLRGWGVGVVGGGLVLAAGASDPLSATSWAFLAAEAAAFVALVVEELRGQRSTTNASGSRSVRLPGSSAG